MIHDKEHMALLEEREPQCRLCPLTHVSPNQGESPGDHHYSKTGEGRRHLIILITKQVESTVYIWKAKEKNLFI